jgi:hypothetical protein
MYKIGAACETAGASGKLMQITAQHASLSVCRNYTCRWHKAKAHMSNQYAGCNVASCNLLLRSNWPHKAAQHPKMRAGNKGIHMPPEQTTT